MSTAPKPALKVIDLGVGMAAGLTAKLLAEFGAEVTRIEPSGGDPFYGVYEAYAAWHRQSKRAVIGDLEGLLAGADLCLVGGESYPGLDWAFDVAAMAARHPHLVVVEMTGYVAGTQDPTPAVDLLVQARTGLVWEQFDDHPVFIGALMPTYGAALLGVIGGLSALIEREGSGLGQCVSTSMQQGTALFWSQLWMDAERADATFDMQTPKGAPHLIFQCADGGYLQTALGVPEAKKKLYEVLRIDQEVSPSDRGMPRSDAPPRMYFADLDLIGPYFLLQNRDDLVKALQDVGLAAEPVLKPGEAWDDPQVLENGTIRTRADGGREVGSPVKVIRASETPPAPAPRSEAGAPPLRGLRVVDLGTFVAGPYASKLLVDLGADVIKVEPLGGNPMRAIVRHTRAAESGKRSICLDTKSDAGADVLRRLTATADAVHYNYRVGVAARLGYDPATLRQSKPDVVTLQTFAYGATGPKAMLTGLDMVAQAICGIEYRAGGKGNVPLWYRSPALDYGAGGLGAAALLHGLLQRIRQGGAMELETSLLDMGLFMVSDLIQSPDGVFSGAPPLDHARLGFHPAERLYPAKDGWIAIAARGDDMAARLASALGLTDLGPRATWGDAQVAAVAGVTAGVSLTDLLARFKAADVWCAACEKQGWAQTKADPAARDAKLVVEVEDADYGPVTSIGPLVDFSRSSLDTVVLVTPGPGSHTRTLLGELGYDAAAVDDLFAQRAVA